MTLSYLFQHNILRTSQRKGTNQKKEQCKECGRSFDNLHGMQKHFTAVHERLKCEQCKYISFGEIYKKIHDKASHPRIGVAHSQESEN